jgi:hypothetical protein
MVNLYPRPIFCYQIALTTLDYHILNNIQVKLSL